MAARNVEDLIEDQPSSDTDGSPSPGPVELSEKRNQPTISSSPTSNGIIAAPCRVSSRVKTKNRKVSSLATPRRHATREVVARKKPNYDMKYHPMDVVTRPNAKRTRVAEAEEDDDSLPPTSEGRTTRSKSVGVKKINCRPETSSVFDPENLFTRPIELDWLELSDFDRRVYDLQQGSPIKGTAIPMKWSRVAQIIISEKYLTRRQLKDWGGEEELKQRYERVRLQMVAFFGAEKEPDDRKDWKVYQMEGFEVYDLPSTYTGKTNGEGSKPQAEAIDAGEIESEDESEEGDDDLMEYRLGSEDVSRHISARLRALYDDSSDELSESMHEIHDDIMDSVNEVMMTEGEVGREYEQHIRQKEAVDIVLSDRASTASATSPHPKDSHYPTEAWQTTPAPVAPTANMTKNSEIEDGLDTVPVVSADVESAGGSAGPPCGHGVDTSDNLAVNGIIRASSEPADLIRLLKDLLPDATESFDAANPSETSLLQPQTPVNVKRMKRAASSVATFTIHEDPEDISVQVHEQVALHPTSPSMDIPKENYGGNDHDELDLPSQQLLNDWRTRDRIARTNEAMNVSGGTVPPEASQTSPPSTRRRSVFQPLPLDGNLDVEVRFTPRATSVPIGASSGISTFAIGPTVHNFIEWSVRRQRLAHARTEDWMND